MSDSEFLSLAMAARLAGISPTALRRLAEAGAVPSCEIPGDPKHKRVFRRADIELLRAKIVQGFEVRSESPKKARTPKSLVSDEEKERWAARKYPSGKLGSVRALVRSYDLELREMVAREGDVAWLRDQPGGKKLLGPKRSPGKKRSLGRLVQEILRDLRSCGYYEVADVAHATRTLPRQVDLLRVLLQVQENRYGKAESRTAEIQASPEELMRMFLAEEKEGGTHTDKKDQA